MRLKEDRHRRAVGQGLVDRCGGVVVVERVLLVDGLVVAADQSVSVEPFIGHHAVAAGEPAGDDTDLIGQRHRRDAGDRARGVQAAIDEVFLNRRQVAGREHLLEHRRVEPVHKEHQRRRGAIRRDRREIQPERTDGRLGGRHTAADRPRAQTRDRNDRRAPCGVAAERLSRHRCSFAPGIGRTTTSPSAKNPRSAHPCGRRCRSTASAAATDRLWT